MIKICIEHCTFNRRSDILRPFLIRKGHLRKGFRYRFSDDLQHNIAACGLFEEDASSSLT
jgi:hypothetical protein